MKIGKQWLYLVGLGFLLLAIFAAWDLYQTLNGQKNEFEFTIIPLSTTLYDDVEEHFASDPNYQEHVVEANQTVDVNEFWVDISQYQ